MGRIWDWNIIFWDIMERSIFEARLIFDDVLEEEALVDSLMTAMAKTDHRRDFFEEEYALREKSYGGFLSDRLWELWSREKVSEGLDIREELWSKGVVSEGFVGKEELLSMPGSRIDYGIVQTEEAFYPKGQRSAEEWQYDIFESIGITDTDIPLMEWYSTAFEEGIARAVAERFFETGEPQEGVSVTDGIIERISDGVTGQWRADERLQEKALGREKVRRILEGGYDRKEQGESNVKIEFVNTSNMHDEFDLEKAMDMMSQRLCDMMSRSAEGFYL